MAPTLTQISAALRTHQELKNLGLSNNLISAQHRRGELIRLTRGVYLDGALGRQCGPEERAKAVTLALAKTRPTAVVSHQSAALLWGAPLLALPAKVHLSLPGANKNGHRQATLHSSRPAECARAIEIWKVMVTDPLTTIQDCGKTLPLQDSLAIADFFLGQGQLTVEEARLELEKTTGRGSQKVKIMARVMSPLSESPLESLANLVIHRGGLEVPQQQCQIVTPSGRAYRADFAWPHLKILLEVDGLHKYYGAYRPTEDQLRYDNLRQRELELAGWTVIRATWEDLTQRPGLLTGRLRGLGVGLRKTTP